MMGGSRFAAKRSLHPLLCLFSTIGFLIGGMVLAGRPEFPIFLAELCVFYLLFGYWKPLCASVFMFIPISMFFVLLSCLINRNLQVASAMGARVFLVGICAVPALGMPQIRLIRSMNQLHCPKMLTLGMLIAVRFVPVVGAEVRQIREAMKTRGVHASLLNFRCFYRALLIPLIMRLINISDTLSLSLETRGFELEPTPVTVYEPVRFTLRDGVYLVCMLALLVGNILLLGK